MASNPSETSELIVRDFLIKAGLEKTLAALNEECREKSRPTPTVEAWYEMSLAVKLPELLLKYSNGSQLEQTPIVEVLLSHLRTLLGTTVRQPLDKSLLPAQPQRLVLNGEGTCSIVSEYGASQSPVNELPVSPSKPTISVLEPTGTRVVVPMEYSDRHPHERKSRLIQTSTADVPSFSFRPKPEAPQPEDKPPMVSSATPIVHTKVPKSRKDDSEKPKQHGEYYMPVEMRARMIHRSMEVMRKNEEEAARVDTVTKSNAARLKLDDLKKNHQEEAYQLKKKRPCGLCEVKFSEVNLPVAVTLKAIYDLRHTWMLRRTAQLEAQKQAALQARKSAGADLESDLSIVSVEKKEDAKHRVTTLVQNGALLQPTRSYDQRRVCSFCAQFFESDEVYRPSFGAKLAKLQDEKREKEAAEDNKFWDPLMNPISTLDTTSKKARQRRSNRHKRIEAELAHGRSLVSSHNPELDLFEEHTEEGTSYLPTKPQKKSGTGNYSTSSFKPVPKSLLDMEKDAEAKLFREAASMSAFWHAEATNTLMTNGMDSFKKSNKDRNTAKATVV